MKQSVEHVPVDRRGLVLVTEDEPIVRRFVAKFLDGLGYDAIEADHAAAALIILEERSDLDLLITDVGMPGEMNGVDLAFTVRSRWPGLPIIIVSGEFDGELSRLPTGVSFLRKPYRPAALGKLIDQHLPHYQDA